MPDLMEMISGYIKPELIVLIPVLYITNSVLEKSKVNNNYIPYILGGFSILLAGIYTIATAPSYTFSSVLLSIFTSITQGILLEGASLYINVVAVKIPRECRNCGNNSQTRVENIKEETKK